MEQIERTSHSGKSNSKLTMYILCDWEMSIVRVAVRIGVTLGWSRLKGN